MQLRRDASTGRILDGNTPVVLAGGHYHLFKWNGGDNYGLADYGMKIDGQVSVLLYPVGAEPCGQASQSRQGSVRSWASFDELFSAMKDKRNKLLRIFLTNTSNQIRTSLPDNVTDPFTQRHQGDLSDWA